LLAFRHAHSFALSLAASPPLSSFLPPQELGASFDEIDIPEDMAELAAEYREKLIDAVVELDDDVMMAYLDVSGLLVASCNGLCILQRQLATGSAPGCGARDL
jgi:hypothetical protein